jgi:plasmid stabilization system protein ParE
LKKIVWTDEATKRIFEIEDYISRDNPERAARFVDSIINHAETILPGNPEAGRTVPETADASIRELVYKKYRIVYRLNRSRIEILTVFEGHRLLRVGEIEQK